MRDDETFEILDERFTLCVKRSARVEKLFEGCRWAEGPAYVPAGRYLVWSDIPNDRMLRYDETNGVVGVFREPAGYPNGNTLDVQGRLDPAISMATPESTRPLISVSSSSGLEGSAEPSPSA